MLVGGLRGTGIKETPLWIHGSLERMGQILFRPPSVKGWPDGTHWLTSAAVVERMKAARRLAKAKPEAAEWIVDLALDGQAPPEALSAAGEERVAVVLASPEFQLA